MIYAFCIIALFIIAFVFALEIGRLQRKVRFLHLQAIDMCEIMSNVNENQKSSLRLIRSLKEQQDKQAYQIN